MDTVIIQNNFLKMSRLSLIFLAVFANFHTEVWAAVQEIIIYERADQQGDSHTFINKHADLSGWKFFLDSAGSFCGSG